LKGEDWIRLEKRGVPGSLADSTSSAAGHRLFDGIETRNPPSSTTSSLRTESCRWRLKTVSSCALLTKMSGNLDSK